MGRRPNQLILAHFERGRKLADSSNRYEHTCRSCGERFPKGRIDSLTNHLLKKCPAISVQDRQRALLELNNLPPLSNTAHLQNGDVQMNGPTVELPIGTRNWTALETLAEVSRQIGVGDNGEGHPADVNGPENRTPEQQRANNLNVQEQYTLDNPPVSYEQRSQRGQKGMGVKNSRQASLSPATFAAHLSNSRSTSPNLAMAASSMAAAAAARNFVPSMVDPALLADDANNQNTASPEKPLPQDIAEENATLPDNFFNSDHVQPGSWDSFDTHPANMYPDPNSMQQTMEHPESPRTRQYPQLAMNPASMTPAMTTEFSAEYGNGQKSNKPKVRGRFTPSRRKEVQEVRKMGACIRCKMLKKPCSGGTPCNTCKSVESARLWKQPCLRTRIAEEVEMYSAGLHVVLAYHQVNSIKGQVHFRNTKRMIEVSHYPETAIFASINALEGQTISLAENMDPGLSGDFSSETFNILDTDTDDTSLKLEAYMKRMMSVFFDNEPSQFMKVTLTTAHDLSIQKQDSLLTRVLELWAMVHILVDHELRWHVSVKDPDDTGGQAMEVVQGNGVSSYDIICLQLNAAAEKKAAQMCKDVLNELERRLLARSSAAPFATFLVAIIFLNCIEKSTWLFRSWEQEDFKSRWPLDKSPQDYFLQGERITNMLQMLLRMRSVPPKTEVTADDGVVIADGDQATQEYFKKINLVESYAREQQNQKVLDKANSRSYELHFCSRLLLPPTLPA